ncbi:MAG: hypothetical protein WBC44_07055 [Planctomycetaceae bacterium]
MSLVTSPTRQNLSHRMKAILFTLAIVLAMGAGYAYRSHLRYRNVAVHEPGKVYRAAWVEPDVMTDLIEKHRIRTVVNLCMPGEMGEHRWAVEREIVRNAGARLLELPMPVTTDPAGQDLQPHLAALSEAGNFPMLVHCQHGVTRTSKFLAIYDMCIRGKSADESLSAQPLFGTAEHDAGVQAFCRDFEQRRGELSVHATAKHSEVMR